MKISNLIKLSYLLSLSLCKIISCSEAPKTPASKKLHPHVVSREDRMLWPRWQRNHETLKLERTLSKAYKNAQKEFAPSLPKEIMEMVHEYPHLKFRAKSYNAKLSARVRLELKEKHAA